jgi:hypothetical protein
MSYPIHLFLEIALVSISEWGIQDVDSLNSETRHQLKLYRVGFN